MRSRNKRIQGEPELNILPFLNIMVVLVAFLLVNAVFAAMAVLDITLPTDAAAAQQQEDNKPKIVLEVMIYDDYLLVNDRVTGPLKQLPHLDGQLDTKGLHQYLIKVKEQFPDVANITVLSENDTPYQSLISVMDAATFQRVVINGHDVRQSLFPDISIGTAPMRATQGGTP